MSAPSHGPGCNGLLSWNVAYHKPGAGYLPVVRCECKRDVAYTGSVVMDCAKAERVAQFQLSEILARDLAYVG